MPTDASNPPTALIAEDEPLLAAALQAELARTWPALRVVATVGDGHRAVSQALTHSPDVLFLDIRMPGQTGLEAAVELADAWPTDGSRPFPSLVFVTAYDQYACQAFDLNAVDYVLKPVQRPRLQQTVLRLQERLAASGLAPAGIGATLDHGPTSTQLAQLTRLAQLLAQPTPPSGAAAPPARLSVIQASVTHGQEAALVMVPVAEVLYFEAADKYVRVLTAGREVLIRTPLKDLIAQLDPDQFWQVHRGVLVQATAIERVVRDEAGKCWLHLRQRSERLAVSRLYAHRFKPM